MAEIINLRAKRKEADRKAARAQGGRQGIECHPSLGD
jgi:hypothetical protein